MRQDSLFCFVAAPLFRPDDLDFFYFEQIAFRPKEEDLLYLYAMKTEKIYPTSIDENALSRAVAILRDGGVILYPTDTIYAFGCDALNARAIERVCRIKNIDPRRESLSIVCSDISQASEYARIDNVAFRILKDYLPGPYTFVLPASTTLPKVFKGRKTVGVRIPQNEIARRLAQELGNPLLSTSISVDEDAPEESENPESVALRFDNLADLMIDGGDGLSVGSTVVDLTDSRSPELLRPGIGEWE